MLTFMRGQVIPAVELNSDRKQHDKCIYAIQGIYAISVMSKICNNTIMC